MTVKSLLFPTVKITHDSEAYCVLGEEVKGNGETKEFKVLPKVESDGSVSNMPPRAKGVHYLVNAFVFNALHKDRDDLVMFDDTQTIRDEHGRVVSQGGVIFS